MIRIKIYSAFCAALVFLLAAPPSFAKPDFENIMLRHTGSGDPVAGKKKATARA